MSELPYEVPVEWLLKIANRSIEAPSTGNSVADETARNSAAIFVVGAAIWERLERIAESLKEGR